MKFPQTLAVPFVTLFLSVAISGLLIGFYINLHALQDALVNREYEKIKNIYAIIKVHTDQEIRNLTALTKALQMNYLLIEKVGDGSESRKEPDTLQNLIARYLPEMDTEIFEITDINSMIVYSTEADHPKGTLNKVRGIEKALQGQTVLAINEGRDGLSVHALTPLQLKNRIFGVVTLGIRIDDNFALRMAEATDMRIAFADSKGEVAASSLPRDQRASLGIQKEKIWRSLAETNRPVFDQNPDNGFASMYAAMRLADETLCLIVQADITGIHQLLKQQKQKLLILSLIILSVVIILGSVLAIIQIRPLRRLQDKAHEIIKLLSGKKPTSQFKGNEIQTLIQAFDLMSAAVNNYVALNARSQQLERQLRHAHKLEAVGTLAGGIAHEFNNILMTIMMNTDFAIKKTSAQNTVHQSLQISMKAVYRARDLVEQIMMFSRQGDEELQTLHILPLIKESVKMLRSSLPTTIAIKEQIETGSDFVLCSPSHIHQIMMNLCTNAADAMEADGGQLTVRLDEEVIDADDESVDSLKAGRYLCLMIRDTGAGIDRETLEKIFDPFFTTKKLGDGTGMGLAAIHGLVHKIGGTIKAESESGQGSIFTVHLPLVNETEPSPLPSAEPPLPGKGRLLVVDDEAVIIQSIELVLNDLGYETVCETDSTRALALFKQAPARFDLAITDLTMPKLTGIELSKAILALRPDMPIILCTGFGEEMNKKKALSAGVREFVHKPISGDDLAKIVHKILSEH
ncbi:response regulator [Desulfococcaceae bacterium HSG9]|nr:response regulator [Desulfococcaceae bacterium HSG9]